MANQQVIDDVAGSRFTLETPDGIAVAAYRREGEVLAFTHTVVPAEASGKGVGSTLIAGVLAIVRRRSERIVPDCAFVAAYVERHPDVQDLVAR